MRIDASKTTGSAELHVTGGRKMENGGAVDDPVLLTCWKDIARYMGKGVRTVQRWEQTLDLPVRRPRGSGYKSAVVARPHELDHWLSSRWSRRAPKNHSPKSEQHADLELGELIQTSQKLRHANNELLLEISANLEELVRSCREIQAGRGMETCVNRVVSAYEMMQAGHQAG